MKHENMKTDTFQKIGFPDNPTALTTFEQSLTQHPFSDATPNFLGENQ